MTDRASDVAFTPTVKALQERRGSRSHYEDRDFRDRIDADIAAFIAERNSFYLATANAEGQPYIQHRGGPKGFLRVLDEKTLAFADYTGNHQYITSGNLADNDRAYIFLMDYATRSRVKIWGHASVSDDKATIATLMPEGYRARPLQAIIFRVTALDTNCASHIPQKFDAEDVQGALAHLQAKVDALEAELAAYKAQTPDALER
ncbi:pyridoxamine 5'-phosphate oxidase family protein [Parvibaculum sp.]|uniref:pyridoxamine 5'-phosphate oxidase family protein n=1 Tax=Parvibaculum sp. TaxID=2024848 RepID=UPI00272EF082|nr:pyridoxamine 5'-phosphate oxidase family protein [Parvibaculum sp.]MDP1625536.1 pyridoxamine 5'-phosphate oxidase family protein [Parvibaculum sp.]MDP2148085.1 pyridoxamine 5'-phosphate oxidase family protein [Parvibaculum sp.]MDP3328288.1 pyridoxamine 5'-phosphate oxidase family protein [Parvibaculum sp.]